MTVTTRTAAQAIAYIHAAGLVILTEDQDTVWADYLNSRYVHDEDVLPAVRLAISRAAAKNRQRVTVGDLGQVIHEEKIWQATYREATSEWLAVGGSTAHLQVTA